MKKKYRIRLSNDRIVGPFYLNQVGELYLKGHVRGKEKCQLFPGGDWKPMERFPEITELFLKIAKKSVSADELKKGVDKTVVNMAIGKKVKKSEATVTKTKTELNDLSVPNNTGVTDAKGDESVEFNEFKFDKKDNDAALPDYDELEKKYDEESDKADQTEKSVPETGIDDLEDDEPDLDKTVIRRTEQRVTPNLDSTVIINPRPQEETATEVQPEDEEVSTEDLEEEIEEEEEEIDFDSKTEFLDLSQMLPDIKKEAIAAEIELKKEVKKAEEKKKEELKEENEEDEDDDDEEDEDEQPKKKMKPFVAMVILVILYFLAFDEEDEKKKKIEPRRVKIVFPITGEFEEAEKAQAAYKAGMELYRRGSYLTKILAAEKFKQSLFFKFKDNPSLGQLILTYAELLPNVSNKREAGKTIYRLLKISRSKILKDVNIALGTALFYYHFDKIYTAKTTFENFLRVSKPSLKFMTWYLKVCTETGDFTSAKKLLDKLSPVPKKPLETYLFMAEYFEVDEQFDEAKKLLEEAGKVYSRSVQLLLKYADHAIRDEDFKKYKKILQAIYDLDAEGSPLFYAKYLEHMGVLSAMLNENEVALNYFRLALKISESDSLRSKLAALELGGSKNIESLILESKIIDYMRKAKIEVEKKKWESAFKYAIEAADLSITYIPSQLLLSNIQIKRGFFDSAIKTLTDLRKEHPLNVRVNFHLVNAYIGAFKLVEAQREINGLSRTKFAKSAEYASLLGRYYLKSDNPLLTIKWLQEAINRNPLNDKDYFLLATTLLHHRKYKEGQNMLTEAISLDPTNLEYRSLYGKVLYELNDAETAIGYIRGILDQNPDHPRLLGDIATYYHKSGQMKEFEIYKEKVANLVKKDKTFYEFLIEAARTDDVTEDVIKYSKELVKFEPGNLEVRMELAEYLYNWSKYEAAIKELEEVKNRLPSYPKVHYYLAKCYLELDNVDKAIENAEEEIKNNPGLDHGYYVLGDAYKKKEDWPNAIKNLEVALSKNPKSVEALGSLAWIKFRQNQFAPAREMYLRALKEDNSNAKFHKELGQVYKGMGQSGLAVESFRVYLDLMPNAVDKRQIEAEIKNLQ